MDRGISDVKLKGLAMSPNADARAQMVRDHHLGLDVLAQDDDENVRYAVLEALRDELNGGLLDVSKCEDQADYIQHFLNSRDLECADRMFSGTGHTDLLRVLDAWSDQNPEKCLSKENHHSDAEWAKELDIAPVLVQPKSDNLEAKSEQPASDSVKAQPVYDHTMWPMYISIDDPDLFEALNPSEAGRERAGRIEELYLMSYDELNNLKKFEASCNGHKFMPVISIAEGNEARRDAFIKHLSIRYLGITSGEFECYKDSVQEKIECGVINGEDDGEDEDDQRIHEELKGIAYGIPEGIAMYNESNKRREEFGRIYTTDGTVKAHNIEMIGQLYEMPFEELNNLKEFEAFCHDTDPTPLVEEDTVQCEAFRKDLSMRQLHITSDEFDRYKKIALAKLGIAPLSKVGPVDFDPTHVHSESFHSRVNAMLSDMGDGDTYIDLASIVEDEAPQDANRLAEETEEASQLNAGELWLRKAVAEANFNEYQKISDDDDDDKSLEEFVKMASDSGMSMKVNNLGISMTSEDWAEFDKRSADARFANVNEFDSDGDFDVDSDDPLVRARIAHVWHYGLDKFARDPDFDVRWEVYSAMCGEIYEGKVDKVYLEGDDPEGVDKCELVHHRIADWDPKDADKSFIDSETLELSDEWKAVLNQWAEQHPERCALPENRAYDRIKNREGLDELAMSSNPEVRYEVRQALADDYKAGKLDMYGGIAKAGDILVSQMERLSEEEMSIPFNPRSAEDDVLKAWIRKNPDKCALPENRPNNVTDKLDPQMIADGWQAVQKRVDYNVAWSKVAPGIQVYNALEDTHYTTDADKCIVITGTEFEQWPVTEAKLRSTYDVPDKTISIGDAGLASPLPDNNVVYVRPAEGEEVIKTSWGDELHANRPGIEHGDGDVVVASFDNPHNDQWVVNGAVFKSTYERANYDEERVLGRLQEAQMSHKQEAQAEAGTVEVEEARKTMEVDGPAEDVMDFA